MIFSPGKRKFLVMALGEMKVRELEEKSKDKDDFLMAMAVQEKGLTWVSRSRSADQLNPAMRKWMSETLGEEEKWMQALESDWSKIRKQLKAKSSGGEVYDAVFAHLAGAYRETYRQELQIREHQKVLAEHSKNLKDIENRIALKATAKSPLITRYSGANGRIGR